MKKSMAIRLLSAVFIIVLLGFPFARYAQHPLVKDLLTWESLALKRNLVDGRVLLRLTEELKLTDAQRRRIEGLTLRFEERSIRLGAEIKILELRLLTRLKSEPVDRENIDRMVREISTLRSDFSVDYVHYLFDVRETLSASQRNRLRQIDEKKLRLRPHR